MTKPTLNFKNISDYLAVDKPYLILGVLALISIGFLSINYSPMFASAKYTTHTVDVVTLDSEKALVEYEGVAYSLPLDYVEVEFDASTHSNRLVVRKYESTRTGTRFEAERLLLNHNVPLR